MNKKEKAARLCTAAGGLLLTVVILLCIPLTVPRLFGCQIYNVVSGSMEPAIPMGSIVYVKQTEAEEVKTNDVIAFYSSADSGALITHRVVQNRIVSGEFITKGDANEKEDLMPVEYERLAGKVVYAVPMLGSLLSIVVMPAGKAAVACLIVVAVMLQIVAEKLRA